MTQTSDELPESLPTEWRLIDHEGNVETRRVSLDTYQLRTPISIVTLNQQGFDLYRDQSPQGVVIFADWCRRNDIESIPRSADESS